MGDLVHSKVWVYLPSGWGGVICCPLEDIQKGTFDWGRAEDGPGFVVLESKGKVWE